MKNPAGSLHAGTTIVLIATENAVVLACDTYQHASNTGLVAEQRKKVEKPRESLVVAVAGACAIQSSDGSIIDLQTILPPIVAEFRWEDLARDSGAFQARARQSLALLEQQPIAGTVDSSIKPNVDIFVGGRSPSGSIFAFRLKCTGRYVQESTHYRLRFLAIEQITYSINPGKVVFMTLSHSEEIEKRARDLAAGRTTIAGKYPAVAGLREPVASEATLRAVAHDMVQFTIDEDSTIGGSIEIESVARR